MSKKTAREASASYVNEKGEVLLGRRDKRRRTARAAAAPMNQATRLVVVLEGACLETIKVGRAFELLNADDHLHELQRARRELSDARPDVTHQCLLNLLDSPLNKAGLLQIFVHTRRNVLIEVNPHTRLPRTFKRFAGLMVQLLHELRIRSADRRDVLLRVVKNPVEAHLPAGARRVATSSAAAQCVALDEFVPTLSPAREPVVFVIGAFAKGDVDVAYADDRIAFSRYPLSAALACAKTTSAFEKLWDIL